MAFRRSPFINFDTGDVLHPPMDLISILPPVAGQSIDQMIVVFYNRVDVWTFGPAVEMLKAMETVGGDTSIWRHAGYALLATCVTYFEMIGKIVNPGSARRGTAGDDFNYGFCDVYPAFAVAGSSRRDASLPAVVVFRDRLRNGLYHLGFTKHGLWLHNAPEKCAEDFAVEQSQGRTSYLVKGFRSRASALARFVLDLPQINSAPARGAAPATQPDSRAATLLAEVR